MTERLTQSACLFFALTLVTGLALSASGLGPVPARASSSHDCCCQTQTNHDSATPNTEADSDCCPGSEDSDQGPCSCACSGCSATVRTVNLFSTSPLIAPLFASDAQRFVLLPDARPASAVLGVAIQPPIL